MQVTIDRERMIEELKDELKKYEVEYQKTIEIYKTKLAEYLVYIGKIVVDGNTDSLKSPPYAPRSKKEEFEESIELLTAHIEDTIKMEDHEFKELKSGVRNLHISNVSTSTALNAISY